MANSNAPFGFQEIGALPGVVPNSGLDWGKILYSYATKIYRGDPIIRATSGYINSASGATQVLGVFNGCKYYSSAAKMPVQSPYWPAGSPSGTADADGSFISNPNAMFLVQTANSNTTASAATLANVGMTANYNIGTGNTTTGISGAYLDLYLAGDVVTQPFKIVALGSTILQPGSPGSDDTTAYNWVIVSFNFQVSRSLDGHA